MTKNSPMPFGKHKGKEIKDLPWQYVKWALKNVKFTKDHLPLKTVLQQVSQDKSIFI